MTSEIVTPSIQRTRVVAQALATPTRREESSKVPLLSTPSHASLFIRNLQLLDLDQLPDWPDITEQTFGVLTAQKTRIFAAEWTLYRLAFIFDAKQTQATLQELFPALEPRQSIKLRTALLQWLMQLKGTGDLGRQCMLRKSTLDDCKGERFLEVLFHLSTAVLQKHVKSSHSSPAQRLASLKSLGETDCDRVLVLSYSYQAVLQQTLKEKRLEKSKVELKLRDLNEETLRHVENKMKAEKALATHEASLEEAKVEARNLKKQIRHDCAGDRTWLSLIISGDQSRTRDAHAEPHFDMNRNVIQLSEETTGIIEDDTGPVSAFRRNLEKQQAKVVDLRNFQKQLSKRNETFMVARSPFKSPLKSPQKTRIGSTHEGLKTRRNPFSQLEASDSSSPPTPLNPSECEPAGRNALMKPPATPNSPYGQDEKGPNHLESLSERTQRTMAIWQEQTPRPKSKAHHYSKSVQDITPAKMVPTDHAAPEESPTPPESLFLGDVDANSVFKSRSKLRRSPPTSPSPWV